MLLDDIREGLAKGTYYSTEHDEEVLLIKDRETGSEFIVEAFEQSLQIRQTVKFDCQELPEAELSRIYVLCSMINERFSGCKSYLDQWWALTTAADILDLAVTVAHVEIVLGQIEFISLAMLDLVEIMKAEQRLVTDEEVNAALEPPSVH